MEIWTEDSTAGYTFIKALVKQRFNNQLKVIKHSGIGYSKPSKGTPYGGILYHLKNYSDTNKLVLLYIDKALDIQGTADNYISVVQEACRHKDIYIIEHICFEKDLLSFKDIMLLTGSRDKKLYQVIKEFNAFSKDLNTFRPFNFSPLLKNYIMQSCGYRKQYEHVAKMLLADITSVDTLYDRKHHSLSLVHDDKIGPCWVKNCCIIDSRFQSCKRCKFQHVPANKIDYVIINSDILSSVKQIEEYINKYKKDHHQSRDVQSERRYMHMCMHSIKCLDKAIAKTIEDRGYWSYECVYRSIGHNKF